MVITAIIEVITRKTNVSKPKFTLSFSLFKQESLDRYLSLINRITVIETSVRAARDMKYTSSKFAVSA
jgi:hypothetical protein